MLRKTTLQLWPPQDRTVEEPEPAMLHWAAARAGVTARIWLSSPRRLSRYLDKMLNAHVLSAQGGFRS